MKAIWVYFLVLLAPMSVLGQNRSDQESEYDENYEFPESRGELGVNIGVGIGLDYGGIGGKLSFMPIPKLAVFGALGFNLDKAGYNGGIIYRILPEKKVCPYVTGMYGYNAVVVGDPHERIDFNGTTVPVSDVMGSDGIKTYYGASFGAGIELHKRNKPKFWNFELLIPIRSTEYSNDVEFLKQGAAFTPLLPFTFCVGYHFAL